MTLKHKLLITSLLVFASIGSIFSQVTRIRGTVTDATTNEPIPFVNLALQGTTVGTISGFDGTFFLETRNMGNQLMASYMGYKSSTVTISPGSYQEVEIKMDPETIELGEVVVKPGENPAHRILRNIIKNKEQNDPFRIERFQYEIYNKMELDINNITEDYKQKKAFKHFQFIFDYVDTSAITGKTFLPVFITETLSDFYYQKQPKKQKEIIKANKISGMEDDKISEFTGQMYLDFNIYDNYLPILGRQMISPIANFGLMYYKYYLTDSVFRDGHWSYNISFKPKRKQEPTFTGHFWVHDTTFAITDYKIQLAEDVNINFINTFVAEQKYIYVDNSVWFPQKQELFVDFEIAGGKDYGFFGRKTTSYNNIMLNPPLDRDFFTSQSPQETQILENANNVSADEWQKLRHEELSKRENDIYKMVDSVKEVPLYNTLVNIINTFVTGYWVTGPIEIGPYYTLYSFNPIEGSRFKFGCRTSNDFSTKLMLYGHLAYGTKDQKLKYGGGFLYMINKDPRRSFGAFYKHDNEQLGVTDYAFLSDNILSSLFSREQNDKLTTVNEVNMHYEHEWFQGFSNTISARNKMVYASKTVPFKHINESGDTLAYDHITTTEIKLNTRFAYNEKFIMGEFERVSLGTKYPILNLDLTVGLQGLFDGDYEYYKLHASWEHRFQVGPLGDFRYIIDAGRVFGNVPFPFLQLHEGNQTYAFDDYAFNLMNYYEFVSNQYVTLMTEQHFNGLFLNHIPLFRRLKWREIAEAKILMGDISTRQNGELLFPNELQDLNDPYIEAGFGLENVFRFFRVDAIWRLSYLDNPDITKFGILVKMQIKF